MNFMELRERILPMIPSVFSLFEMSEADCTVSSVEILLMLAFPEGFSRAEAIVPFGLFLGEEVIKALPGAHWVDYQLGSIYDACIEVPNKLDPDSSIHCYPFVRLSKFMDDHTDGLDVWYRNIIANATGARDLAHLPANEWLTYSNGDQVRVSRANPDDLPEYITRNIKKKED